MKNCDRKCVQKIITKARRKFPGADFWIPGGAVNMWRRDTNARYIGWPGLKFKQPVLKKDGTPAKGKFITSYFSLGYCPICGGKL